MPTVFVISEDWTLRTAVRAELLEQGIEAMGFECGADAVHAAVAGPWPALVVLDGSTVDPAQPEMSPLLKRSSLLLVTSGIGPLPELPPRATIMRRPVRVSEITAGVRRLLEGQPA